MRPRTPAGVSRTGAYGRSSSTRSSGGPGYGQLKLALLNEIIGRYPGAPQVFGAAAPDTGNIEMVAAYGTEEQKERWLEPLLNQDMFSAFSMTEPQGGSDPNLFRTRRPC
jgi:acyl-CoA dehydrogenase